LIPIWPIPKSKGFGRHKTFLGGKIFVILFLMENFVGTTNFVGAEKN